MSVKITNDDLVLLGHGSYPGGASNTKLPDNVELIILQPVGYTLTTVVAEAMIKQQEIKTLTLHHNNNSGNEVIDAPMAVYKGGANAPNLTLYNLGDLSGWGSQTIGQKKNVVTVGEATLLSDLLKSNDKITKAINSLAKGEKLKLYWSACANQVSGNYASLN